MTAASLPIPARDRALPSRVLLAGATVAVLDGLFAVAFSAAVSGTFAPGRVWQGVARNVIGPAAMDGGAATVALGLAIHVCVAYGWTTLYALLLRASPALRRTVASPARAVAVGVAWGALVWLVMRLVVIPLGRVGWTPIVWRTFVPMLVGHMVVVGQPIALIVRPHAAQQRARRR
jgi:hypothetical protein